MGKRWIAERGWDVEAIVLNSRPSLRVRQHGVLVGDCPDRAALERLLARHGLGLGDLVEQPEG